jgi:predicted DNA-binding ribbon-helix-helix protein
MPVNQKPVRQSVTLPSTVAKQIRTIARSRRLSANRVLVELVEEGIEARQRKEREFFDLAERFRAAKDPAEAERLGDQLGRMVFGG